MNKENVTASTKDKITKAKKIVDKVVGAVEEATEAIIKEASDVATKENVEKTINAAKDTVKNVKSKASKAATAATTAASNIAKAATKSAKKATAEKISSTFYVQYGEREINKDYILQKFEEEWIKEHELLEIKTLEIYFKIEHSTAYCLVNGSIELQVNFN